MASLQEDGNYQRGGRFDVCSRSISRGRTVSTNIAFGQLSTLPSKNKNFVRGWVSQGILGVDTSSPLSQGTTLARALSFRGERGFGALNAAIKQAVAGAIESISDLAGEIRYPEILSFNYKPDALTHMIPSQSNISPSYGPYSSGNDERMGAVVPISRQQRLEKRAFIGPDGGALRIITPMRDQRHPHQRRSSSSVSTDSSIPDDNSSVSGPTASSRSSIDTPMEPTPASPLSKGCRKIFITPARQQSLREADTFRREREAERDRRVNARGQAYRGRLDMEEDSLELQRLLLMKLAAAENDGALCPLGRMPSVSEGELRRQRRECIEALRTSVRLPC